MYSRNCGSNWPSSGALIAWSTRGCALIGPGPIRRRCGGFRSSKSSGMGVVLQPVARDIDAARNPDLFRAHVANELLHGGRPARTTRQAAMQTDRHHAAALGVEDIEAVLEVFEEVVAGVEALCRGEAHVVGIQRIRNDELWLAVFSNVARVVPGQIVVVVVSVVDEAAVLDHELAGVGTGAPGVPAKRPLTGEPLVDLDRALHVLALDLERNVLVVD